jgi:hypothetical protein
VHPPRESCGCATGRRRHWRKPDPRSRAPPGRSPDRLFAVSALGRGTRGCRQERRRVLLIRQIAGLLFHAVAHHHAARDVCNLHQIVGGACRHAAVDDVLGRAAAQRHPLGVGFYVIPGLALAYRQETAAEATLVGHALRQKRPDQKEDECGCDPRQDVAEKRGFDDARELDVVLCEFLRELRIDARRHEAGVPVGLGLVVRSLDARLTFVKWQAASTVKISSCCQVSRIVMSSRACRQ